MLNCCFMMFHNFVSAFVQQRNMVPLFRLDKRRLKGLMWTRQKKTIKTIFFVFRLDYTKSEPTAIKQSFELH